MESIAPENALDPLVVLAMGLRSQPGVYAVLLGSGVSTGAGIPTGWGVVEALVQQAAAAANPKDPDAAERAAENPEQWWAEHGDGKPLGYSRLLESLSDGPSSRMALLSAFFEPTTEDMEQGLKVPSPAHRALARLVKEGYVRVILTTNFDRLMERALEEVGSPPQVISGPDTIRGMTPLAHAHATVIKVHGDYADLRMRNTVEELSEYPSELNELLGRVFEEYGLVVCGWSADWDTALVSAISSTISRRYSLFWDERSSKGEPAQQLLTNRLGIRIPVASADELFEGLHERVLVLEKMSEPPLTTAIAISRLKRYLPDPSRRVELTDLVAGVVEHAAGRANASPVSLDHMDAPVLQGILDALLEDVLPTLHLLVTGIVHDKDLEHVSVWRQSLQRLMAVPLWTPSDNPYYQVLVDARHYPALLALRAMGVASLHAHGDLPLSLLKDPYGRDPKVSNTERIPAVHALHEYRVLSHPDLMKKFPRWNGARWPYIESHLLRADLREVLRPFIPDEEDYNWANDRYEYRVALLQNQTQGPVWAYQSAGGEFLREHGWSSGAEQPAVESDFRAMADQASDDWPWRAIVEGPDGMDVVLGSARSHLRAIRERYR